MTDGPLESAVYRFTVRGRVQGVFFRQSTVNEARRLGITGWVRNLSDGIVEGLACGDRESLRRFREWLAKGPPAARVESVAWVPDAAARPQAFVVRS